MDHQGYPYCWNWHSYRPSVMVYLCAVREEQKVYRQLIHPWLTEHVVDRFGQRCRVLARSMYGQVQTCRMKRLPPGEDPGWGIGCLTPLQDNWVRLLRGLRWRANSVLVEFTDGYRMVASARGLRWVK